MAKKKATQTYSPDQTVMAFGIGLMAGVAVGFMVESIVDDLTASGLKIPGFPVWRIHMATICIGVFVFILTFYSLEALGRKSKGIAWRSTIRWLPLMVLTAAATIVHLPVYGVIFIALAYSVWAFRRMSAIR
jgi:hypothetical protein